MNIKIFDTFPILESERLTLRNFKLSDAKDLFQIRSNCMLMAMMGSYRITSSEEALNLIISFYESFTDKRSIVWAIVEKNNNKVVGYLCLYKIIKGSSSAEICYALNPEFWGKGFMSEAINRIVKFAFDDLQVKCLEAEVAINNKRSIKVLEKSGFKRGIYFDENLFNTTESINNPIYFLFEKDYHLEKEQKQVL